MQKRAHEILHLFDGKLVGTMQLKHAVSQTMTFLPLEIIDYITTKCWFVGSLEDAWAFTFTGNDIKDQHLVFLSDELFHQPEEQIRYTILHEIGHVMLKHRNATLVKQSKQEIKRQEQEAHAFAKSYIS